MPYEKVIKMKKQKPITKHLAPQYYELAKEKILSDRMCWDYAMKFQRCKNDIDYMQLGLGLQSIPFVVESIEQGVIPIPTLKEQLEPYINGKYIVKNVMQLERVSGEYFIDFNNDCAGKCFVLTADIDLNGQQWEAIGKGGRNSADFSGTFNGQYHMISSY